MAIALGKHSKLLIKNDIIDYTPEDMKIDKAKAELRDIISRLEVIRDEI